MIIGIDVDGPVADLLPAWLEAYNRDWHDTLQPKDITNWKLDTHVKPECGMKIYEYLVPEIYDHVKPTFGALVGIQTLRAMGHQVVFVTVTPKGSFDAKLDWLIKHGFIEGQGVYGDGRIYADYFPVANKGLLRLDVLVDDRPENFVGLGDNGGQGILFTQAHNVDDNLHTRFNTWEEIVDFIKWYDSPTSEKPKSLSQQRRLKVQMGDDYLLGPKALASLKTGADLERLVQGTKYDGEKLRFDLLPSKALREMAKLYTYGAGKYADRNWEKGIEYGRMYAAMWRHAVAFWEGEDIDKENDCHHMASVAFYAFAFMEYYHTHPEFDNRPLTETKAEDTLPVAG